jgi:hypothetical protein
MNREGQERKGGFSALFKGEKANAGGESNDLQHTNLGAGFSETNLFSCFLANVSHNQIT